MKRSRKGRARKPKKAARKTKKKAVSRKRKTRRISKKKTRTRKAFRKTKPKKSKSAAKPRPRQSFAVQAARVPPRPGSGGGCPECSSGKIKYDDIRGETVCESCGFVLSESMIDVTQEWRAFDEDQRSRRVRTGAVLTPTKHDQGITTEIGKGRGELFKVASKKRAQYYRLTKWHKRLIKSRDRNLSFALSELQRLVSILTLSKAIHERVAKLYQQAVNKGLVRGRSTESIIAALLYTTCREEGAPRTLDEISKASGINKKDIGKTYRYIARKLRIRILPAKAQDYVPRFGSLLGLSERVQVKAVDVLDDAAKYDVTSGKGPIGVAAAALYIAAVLSGEKKTQREVADVIGVTEVTIRNRYKEMVDSLGIKDEVEERVKEEEDEIKK
jgi:transcription initiation factor TFIIB